VTQPPLRILFVCSADFSAPSTKQVLLYAHELLARGHAVAVSLGGERASLEDEPSALRPEAWRHRFVGPRLARDTRSRAAAFGPSVVHAFNPRAPVLAVARTYSRDTGAPVLVHFEDDEWGLARGRPDDSLGRRLGRRASRAGGVVHPPLWPLTTRAGLEWVSRHATALDALTPALCAEVTRRLGRDCAEVPPPAPPPAAGSFATVTGLEAIPPERSLIAYTGAVFGAHLVDFELALAAVGLLRAEGRPVAFVQAGRTAPRFDLPALAARHGLGPDSAAFLGYRGWAEIEALMAEASVLVQPGRPNDFNRLRLPSKLPAYLRSGTPTVTFATGSGELLADRREVVKTYTGEASELAARTAELLDDARLAATLAENGPRAAERLFSASRVTGRLVDHYRRALGD